MVQVMLGGTLKSAAGGRATFEVEASDIKELLARLGEACPALKPRLDQGVAVSIDGRIYRNAWFEPVPPESEVYILPRMSGG